MREAVETLTEEYRDRLEEISATVQHYRQDITANDDVYFIRWQDVLVVFSSYISGDEQGTPVAALTENQVDKLREAMWAMNAVDYSTRAETAVIETTDKNGKATTTEITETVLVIELTHKTPDEMAVDYHFTTRQNTYLQLLQDLQYEEPWTELLGGFEQGGGELMNPDGTHEPEPRIAESYEISEDGLDYTFHLRDDVTFHDGTPVTAEDVVFSLETYQASEYQGSQISMMTGVEAVDENTVVCHLDTPYAPFLQGILSPYIFPKAYYESDPEAVATNPIGSGPYKFVSRTTGSNIILESNEDYYRGAPAIKNITFE